MSTDQTDQMEAVQCSGCERRYLRENATILSETVQNGEIVNPDDDHERCPFCGQTTESSSRVPVTLDFEEVEGQ